jgi:phospho-N-acetylmuramoyl-pentapeptide-transferase
MPLLDLYPWSTALTLSTVTFLFTVIWGRSLIQWLKRRGIGKQIRVDGPQSHQVKMGTPTMGGWLFISGVVIITVALNIFNLIQRNDEGRSILLPLATLVMFGFLGAVDDWEGIKGKRVAEGLTARTKFTIQVLLAAGIGLVLYYGLDIHSIALPGVEERINID